RRRVGGGEDVLGVLVRRVARAGVQRDRDVGGLPVLADQRGRALIERADDVGDVRQRLQVLHRVIDRGRVGGVGDRAGAGDQGERDAPVGLLGQLLLQQVGGVRRARPRQRQVVVP